MEQILLKDKKNQEYQKWVQKHCNSPSQMCRIKFLKNAVYRIFDKTRKVQNGCNLRKRKKER